jgi:molybdopterin molybdotransferase
MTKLIQLPALNTFQEDWQNHRGSDLFNPKALGLEAALEFMRSYTEARLLNLKKVSIPIEDAFGRILAVDIKALINVPAANNSAMDGYAFHSSALSQDAAEIQLQVLGKQFAGDSLQTFTDFQASKHAIQITTGALLPPECDTVIPQEWVQLDKDQIIFSKNKIRAQENCRMKGEDLQIGEIVLSQGRRLKASDMGMLASMGLAQVEVFEQLKVAIFSTGNEVTAVGEPLLPGRVYDSNRFTLIGLLKDLNIQLIDFGIVKDDAQALKDTFSLAAEQADLIITSGGVSVGEADFTKQVMRELGDVAFWTLAIKPGRPMAFGKIVNQTKESVLFGLPGNPVAVMITFLQFVKPMIEYLSGSIATKKIALVAKLSTDIKKRPGRTEFLRARLNADSSGQLWVEPYKNQGSGVLSSMSQADCLIVLEASTSVFERGNFVNIEMLL